MNTNEIKTWQERFDEMIFSRLGGYGDQILYREKEIKSFINSEIDIAVKAREKKVVEEIENWVKEHRYISDDLAGGFAVNEYELTDFLTSLTKEGLQD